MLNDSTPDKRENRIHDRAAKANNMCFDKYLNQTEFFVCALLTEK